MDNKPKSHVLVALPNHVIPRVIIQTDLQQCSCTDAIACKIISRQNGCIRCYPLNIQLTKEAHLTTLLVCPKKLALYPQEISCVVSWYGCHWKRNSCSSKIKCNAHRGREKTLVRRISCCGVSISQIRSIEMWLVTHPLTEHWHERSSKGIRLGKDALIIHGT
jgi:hypothetical protein